MTERATTDPVRSKIMRAVKGRHTLPEMIVRRAAHGLGYRFRLHRADLPGKPDLVFPKRRKVIFVHGCWWHAHDCKRGARTPKTNVDYWRRKIQRNAERDAEAVRKLRAMGWTAETLWECELRDASSLRDRLRAFLEGD